MTVIVQPLTVDQARALPGSFTAFERADGEPFYDEFSWITGFDERDWEDAGDAPFVVREIVMVPVLVRTFRVGVHEFEPCDDDSFECNRCSGEVDSEFHQPREVEA